MSLWSSEQSDCTSDLSKYSATVGHSLTWCQGRNEFGRLDSARIGWSIYEIADWRFRVSSHVRAVSTMPSPFPEGISTCLGVGWSGRDPRRMPEMPFQRRFWAQTPHQYFNPLSCCVPSPSSTLQRIQLFSSNRPWKRENLGQ